MRNLVSWNSASHAMPTRAAYHSGPWFSQGVYPALDLYRTADALVAQVAVPGVKPEDIEVTLSDNVLLIKGKRERQHDVEDSAMLHRERTYGSFARSITLPGDLDASQAKAEFEDGVLTLTVPMAEEAKPKSIQIKVK